MKKVKNLYDKITFETVKLAAKHSFKGHFYKNEVCKFQEDLDNNCRDLLEKIRSGEYISLLEYRSMKKKNNDGKLRDIKCPSLKTRIYQHLVRDILTPIYKKKDNKNGLNCKKKCGLNSKIKNNSVIHKIKRAFYDRKDLNYWFIIDQRQCYKHIKKSVVRKQMKKFIDDKKFIDFVLDISFCGDELPIGTPTSPLIHHLVMLSFDYFIKEISPYCLRYADDNLVFAQTKEEANILKWRIKNYWWYELGIRAKRSTGSIYPIERSCDFCGFVIKTNNKNKNEHNKGYVRGRNSIVRRAKKSINKNWPSYFGILKSMDQFNLMTEIEKKMKLRELTRKIRITRKLDAEHIEVKDLIDQVFNLYDYEIRHDKNNDPNWIKCLIGIEDEETGRYLAREFHGNYQGIIKFICECEKKIGRDKFLPLEEIEIENSCGYIFRNSTNKLKYIEDEKY